MGMVEAQMNSNEKSDNRGVQTEQMHKEKQMYEREVIQPERGEADSQTSGVPLTSGVCCILTLNLYGNESE